MNPTYFFRLDDICPTMHWDKFNRLTALFDRYQVKPLLGIVPDNRDTKLRIDPPAAHFWPKMRQLQQQGYLIAQHGYQHCYTGLRGGLLGLHRGSEFAGKPYQEQLQLIYAGKKILEDNLQQAVTWWMAPGHSFDVVTCQALVAAGFTYITDGIALYPFRRHGLTWIPQQLWQPQSIPFGFWTICLHPNTMQESDFIRLKHFLATHNSACRQLDFSPHSSLFNPLFRWAWYAWLRYKQGK